MATLTTTQTTPTGTTPTGAAVSSSDKFTNDGKTRVLVENGSGSTLTVGIATPATIKGFAIGDGGGTIANGAKKVFGPFPPELFNDANGQVTMTFDQTTSVTAFVFN